MIRLLLLFALGSIPYAIVAQNNLPEGLSRKLSYGQMVVPYAVQVTFNKTVHILFPAAIRYVDLGSSDIIAGKADGAENVLRIKAAIENFSGETNFSVITEDGHFYSFNALYSREPEILNVEMQDFIRQRAATNEGQEKSNATDVKLPELHDNTPELADLVMRSVYRNNERRIKHLGCKRFGIQMLLKGLYVHDGLYYFHTQVCNSSNVAFDVDFIRFKVVDKKIAKRTAIQETILNPVRSYNEETVIEGQSTVRTVYVLPKFTIPDDKLLLVELFEKNGGRHQVIRIEGIDIERAKTITKLKTK
ncbi:MULTISPECIES: conjugative transposon protein TraN [Bacteroidales]|uniref:conjugative transposon protein TraN n=1 Tax=Bacteroidales TaxID=171549 RepID=UPI00256FD100|nr:MULTISPECIES: conjugative transposon protein TraN [Bacteroidales]